MLEICKDTADHKGYWWAWVDDSGGTFHMSDVANQAISYFTQKFKVNPRALVSSRAKRQIYLWYPKLSKIAAECATRNGDKFEPKLPEPKKSLIQKHAVSKNSSIIKGKRKKRNLIKKKTI